MSKRFFAFGCSYTEYEWPTWADILGRHFYEQGWEVYNFGNSGTGNNAIFQHLLKADADYNITKDDVVCIMWSSWNREDRLARWHPTAPMEEPPVWNKMGNCLWNPNFDDEWIRKYWSLENDIMLNVNIRRAVNKAFPHINFHGTLVHNEAHNLDLYSSETFDIYQTFDKLSFKNCFYQKGQPGFDKLDADRDQRYPTLNSIDGHPNPELHMWIAEHLVGPHCGVNNGFSDDIKKWVDVWQQRLDGVEMQLYEKKQKGQLTQDVGFFKVKFRKMIYDETNYCKRHHDLWDTYDDVFNTDGKGSTEEMRNYLLRNAGLF